MAVCTVLLFVQGTVVSCNIDEPNLWFIYMVVILLNYTIQMDMHYKHTLCMGFRPNFYLQPHSVGLLLSLTLKTEIHQAGRAPLMHRPD